MVASVTVRDSVGFGCVERGRVVARREIPEERDELVTVPERRGATCSHVPCDATRAVAGVSGMVGRAPQPDHEGSAEDSIAMVLHVLLRRAGAVS